MFERDHHRRVAVVLSALDGPRLVAHRCLFGGGTAIALRYGEFRESVDIDFCVSDADGYREVRAELTGPHGLAPLWRITHAPLPNTNVRADAYGVRTRIDVGGVAVRFEIIREARIELDPPESDDVVCGVATLARHDMIATKLLANADRWADDSAFSRDLIDLAMMQPKGPRLDRGLAKARTAYGDAVLRDLAAAVDGLRRRPGRLDRCMQSMKMQLPRAVLWDRIRTLERAVLRRARG
jgi:Nucleotidyl transferase AbiEii toxin, Type IV TA system